MNTMLLHVCGPAKVWRSTRVQQVWGVGKMAPSHSGERNWKADAQSALPHSWAPKMGQWPRSTTATRLSQPSAIGPMTVRGPAVSPSLQGFDQAKQCQMGEEVTKAFSVSTWKYNPPHLHHSQSRCTHKTIPSC